MGNDLSKSNKPVYSIGIILAAGNSTRTGDKDKMFLKLDGIPLIIHSISKFSNHKLIDYTIVVVSENKKLLMKEIIRQWDLKNVLVVCGGERRQDSVLNALKEVRKNEIFNKVKLVAIHDGARPFFSENLLSEGLDKAKKYHAAIPVIPMNDTVKIIDNNKFVQKTLDRSSVFIVQTPQIFSLSLITDAHQNRLQEFTDDASMVELLGNNVKVFNGEYKNIKITTTEDLEKLNIINSKNSNSVFGLGIDSHRLKLGIDLLLGGIKIDYNKGLDGHSDGDVLLHSICDAILGALGLIDLGYHFPSTDLTLQGVDSSKMLKKILIMMKEKNFEIKHLDSTIITQEPKISDYREKIENNLSNLLGINEFSVNIKATTTDFLGFIGNSEGIAAQSIVTLNDLNN
ncbi:MAG: bifunctional 2-C-methyl-D-erythritol 4-phosphate cytidylyltransferase/2-C-methyl-D-erythritol 2,4-cyclodiphosphate synthase [Chloroflexi bacterium]|nr:bifunctional 2-C-methyl-D-erythritol 4-phosphate cytidylyltransferase/2-C-methyl-D-erythritol 2,4-cyclodiphosphate synthase [Chloroflexota bacterium]